MTVGRPPIEKQGAPLASYPPVERLFALDWPIACNRNLVMHAIVLVVAAAVLVSTALS
jgi:hypothetical protein